MKLKNNSLTTYFTAVMVTFLFACGQNYLDKNGTKSNNSSTEGQQLTIDTFSTFPPEIEGCTCYFSNDSIEFKKGNYIYMNDFGQTSFMKINGNLTKFTQTDFKDIGNTKTITKAKSADYEITIEINTGRGYGYETSIHTGLIKLTDNKGNTIIRTFYGLCGC